MCLFSTRMFYYLTCLPITVPLWWWINQSAFYIIISSIQSSRHLIRNHSSRKIKPSVATNANTVPFDIHVSAVSCPLLSQQACWRYSQAVMQIPPWVFTEWSQGNNSTVLSVSEPLDRLYQIKAWGGGGKALPCSKMGCSSLHSNNQCTASHLNRLLFFNDNGWRLVCVAISW